MKDTKRAQRIAEKERLKKARKNYWGNDRQLSDRHLGMVVSTPKVCSCWMCGNPRKKLGEATVQELRSIQDEGWDG